MGTLQLGPSRAQAEWETKSEVIIYLLLSGRSNVFLVCSQDASILVDTSWQFARSKLQASLDGFDFHTYRSLTALFLTHAHFDHAGNAAWVHERYRPKLIVQENEVPFLCNGDNALPAGTNFLARLILPRFGGLGKLLVRYPPAYPDIAFDNRMDLSNLGFDAYLLHTPGHSAGSSSLILGGEIALVGDAMFGVFPHSAFPPFAEDPQLLVRSWKKLLETGCQLFIPAHGKGISRDVLEEDYLKTKNSKKNTTETRRTQRNTERE
jgi:hydroxyacylglutathione hydrolase